ncbi:hypothetical protein PAHAL_6G110200 [Panicum hallii]|uniref:Uncharacterized protein n=1 Tax=Panicum hallii TaxID=206008 RepID=A0A2T8IFX9_9POAL|nr:hypothetical protein PAHAL_6G110200 [Panicum hallii]
MRAAHEDGTFVAPICAAASAWLAVASHSCALTGCDAESEAPLMRLIS